MAFCDAYPNSNLARLAILRRALWGAERFVFIDRYGNSNRGRDKGVPQPERDEEDSG